MQRAKNITSRFIFPSTFTTKKKIFYLGFPASILLWASTRQAEKPTLMNSNDYAEYDDYVRDYYDAYYMFWKDLQAYKTTQKVIEHSNFLKNPSFEDVYLAGRFNEDEDDEDDEDIGSDYLRARFLFKNVGRWLCIWL